MLAVESDHSGVRETSLDTKSWLALQLSHICWFRGSLKMSGGNSRGRLQS